MGEKQQQLTATMGKGQNEGGFSEDQLQMYKDCFKLMDINKDGQLDKNDLRGAFDNVGVLMSEGELDGLLGEIGGACTYDNMVKMFQEKMAGDGNDSDDLIVQAFKAYDNEGKIDSKMFTHALMTWGDKMTKAEIDDIFGEFEIDEDYMIKSKDVIGLFVAVKEEEKKEEAPPPVVEEAPAEEDEGEARRRRRRRPLSKWLFQYLNEASNNPGLPSASCTIVHLSDGEPKQFLRPTSARLSLHS